MIVIVLVAAVTDARGGKISNWLTLSAIVFAPIAHGVVGGVEALIPSLFGLLTCAAGPYLLFQLGAMGGGDLKLFAALGAVGGVYVGLEAQLLAVMVAAFYGAGMLAWSGQLGSSLVNALFLVLNPLLPRRFRRPLSPALMHSIRLGPAALLGTLIAIAGHHQELLR